MALSPPGMAVVWRIVDYWLLVQVTKNKNEQTLAFFDFISRMEVVQSVTPVYIIQSSQIPQITFDQFSL
jgi:hypothetical protein